MPPVAEGALDGIPLRNLKHLQVALEAMVVVCENSIKPSSPVSHYNNKQHTYSLQYPEYLELWLWRVTVCSNKRNLIVLQTATVVLVVLLCLDDL